MIRAALSGCYTALAAGITVDLESRRRGSPICALARKLVEAGHNVADELHIYRGETLCFRPAPLAKWAGLRVKEGDHESARFAPHREPPSDNADSGGREREIIGHLAHPGAKAPEKTNAAPAPAPAASWQGPSSGLAAAAGASPPVRGAAPPVQGLARGSDDKAA